jgi:hypothetical protein
VDSTLIEQIVYAKKGRLVEKRKSLPLSGLDFQSWR